MTRQKTFWIALAAVAVLAAIGAVMHFASGANAGAAMLRYQNPAGVDAKAIGDTLAQAGVTVQSIEAGSSTKGGTLDRVEIRVSADDGQKAFDALKTAHASALIGDVVPESDAPDDGTGAAATPEAVERLYEAEAVGVDYPARTLVLSALWIAVGALVACVYMVIRFGWQAGVSAFVMAAIDVAFVLGVTWIVRTPAGVRLLPVAAMIAVYSFVNSAALFDAFRALRKQAAKTEDWQESGVAQTKFRAIALGVFGVALLIAVAIFGYQGLMSFALPAMLGVAFGTFSTRHMTPALYHMLAK